MKIFLCSCLFLAILAPVIAVQCKVKKTNEKTEKTCETTEGGSCFTHLIISNFNGSVKVESESGCTTDCTSENYSFTTKQRRYIQNFRECCHAAQCTKKFFKGPKLKLNGKECPFCFPSLSKDCKGSETIKCHNAETQCIEFVVAHDNSSIPDKHFYGCAAPTLCSLAKNPMHSGVLSGTITRARCFESLTPLE